MLCYRFLTKSPSYSAKVSQTQAPFAQCGSQGKHYALPHGTEQDTLPIASLISMQVIPYRS
jgi:hypothetical protein